MQGLNAPQAPRASWKSLAIMGPGGHIFPEGASELIVRFFKEHTRTDSLKNGVRPGNRNAH